MRITILVELEKITKSGLSSVKAICAGNIKDFDGISARTFHDGDLWRIPRRVERFLYLMD